MHNGHNKVSLTESKEPIQQLFYPLGSFQLMFGRFGQVVEKKRSISLQDISAVSRYSFLFPATFVDMAAALTCIFLFPPPVSGPGGAAAAVQHAGLRDLLHALRSRRQQGHRPGGGASLRLQ